MASTPALLAVSMMESIERYAPTGESPSPTMYDSSALWRCAAATSSWLKMLTVSIWSSWAARQMRAYVELSMQGDRERQIAVGRHSAAWEAEQQARVLEEREVHAVRLEVERKLADELSAQAAEVRLPTGVGNSESSVGHSLYSSSAASSTGVASPRP